MHVELLSPNGAEGAAVFEVTGGTGLGEVTAEGGEVYQQNAGGTITVVVILDNPGRVRLQVRAENVRQLPSVRVVQVAGGDNQLRSSLSGYEVEILQVEDEVSP
jgi:hypothetical protein